MTAAADDEAADAADHEAEVAAAGRPAPSGPGAWLLVAGALLPLVLGVLLVREAFGGGLDRILGVPEEDGGGSLWVRWQFLWYFSPLTRVVVSAATVLVVLAVLRLAGRPAWWVPGRAAARAGAVVAVLVGLASAVLLVVAVLSAARPSAEQVFATTGSPLLDLGSGAAEAAVAVVLSGLAAAALLRPGPARVVEAGEAVEVRDRPDGGPAPAPAAVEPVAAPAAEAAPRPAPVPPRTAADVPRPSEADLLHYRRPAP